MRVMPIRHKKSAIHKIKLDIRQTALLLTQAFHSILEASLSNNVHR